ncbi:MAG: two-component sensor histidine kinase [Deltaproteobacteria bacterium]|nr:two-component sensor histidine kinase [Deltaproteobacteria bacterium]
MTAVSSDAAPPPSQRRGLERDPTQLRRLTWITFARLLLYLLLLAAIAGFHLQGDAARYPASLRVVVLTLSLAFGAAAVYAAWIRTRRALQVLAWLQVVLDQAIWTVLVYLSGGPLSGATTFYGLSCVLAAVTLGLPGALAAALIGGVLFAALVVGLSQGWIAGPIDQSPFLWRPEVYLYPTLVSLIGLTVVAVLSGYLARRLQTQSGELAVVTERAERAERLAALGRIAAALAHEIRNPLGSISGSIEIIREAPGLGDDERRLCEIIRHEVTRLNELVGDMMDLAKPRAPNVTVVDLVRVARDVIVLAQRGGRAEHDVPLRYEGPESLTVHADGGQIRQVVWNLVRNAIQASGAGLPVTVRVGEDARKEPFVEVNDRGLGVSPEMRARMFDAFVTTRAQGVGIGLAVVKQIVDAHNATIEVEEAKGGGTTLRVTLVGRRA